MTAAPKIENRWACIASDKHVELAAQLSSYFNEPGVFFALFEFTSPDHPYEEIATKDGYLSQVFGNRSAILTNNCLAHMQPDFIILLGANDIALSYLKPILPPQKLIYVNNEEELLALPFAAGKPAPLQCKPDQVIHGLIAARAEQRPLTFSPDAPDIPAPKLVGKKGLILLETQAGVNEVAIINYAYSIDADIVLAAPFERDRLHSLPRQLQAWAEDRSSPALREVRREIIERIKGIDFQPYEFATFFTAGLPYGLILENVIPVTHVLNGPLVGAFISSAVSAANAPMTLGSAVLFSLDDFEIDEIRDVAQKLDQSNFVLTSLVGKDATNENLHNYGSYLPYDLLHLCSHGGETDGYLVKQDFTDRDGIDHCIEYFEVVSFSEERALQHDHIVVERKTTFTTFDGVPWIDRPLSKHPPHVGSDMMQAIREDGKRLKRIPVKMPIAFSCHIKCYQSFHQGNFQHLASYTNPIVFNNSCSSSHELAAAFVGDGARCYIGTLWNVGTVTATKAAIAFYDSLLSTGKALAAFSAMLQAISKDAYKNIYIFWRLHFTSLVAPTAKSDDQIILGLVANYSLWLRGFATSKDEEIRRNSLAPIRFFKQELRRRVTPERLETIIAQLGEEPEVERSGDDESHVSEVTFRNEIPRSS